MRLINIGLANVNTTVGAVKSNAEALTRAALSLAADNCTIAAFPEQVLGGYPSEDLTQWRGFVADQERALLAFADATAETSTVFCVSLTAEHEAHLYGVIAVVCRGKILGLVPKENLPTYGVFHEWRVWSPWTPGRVEKHDCGAPIGDLIFRFPFGIMGTEVCEDGWVPDGPALRRAYAGSEVIVNCSASPFRAGVIDTRREMLATRSGDNNTVLAYCNAVGGNDSLVFDGGGFVHQNGRLLKELPRWIENEAIMTVDLDRTELARSQNTTWRSSARRFQSSGQPVPEIVDFSDGPMPNGASFSYPAPATKSFFLPSAGREAYSPRERFFEDIEEAMTLALTDYYRKTGAFRCFGIALSGGKDSALAAIIAWRTAKRLGVPVHCFSMPTRFNSEATKGIARDLAAELGASFVELPIAEEFEAALLAQEAMVGQGTDELTLQNIQARIRGTRMWNWSNQTGGLWIQTGNMSEKAVGYTTIGGDMGGAYSLLGNLPKTVVIAMLGYLGKKYELRSIEALLATKASAELALGQEDEKDLMPFPVLDACMYLLIGEKMSPLEIYQALRSMWTDAELKAMDPSYGRGTLKEWVTRFVKLFRRSLFKWVQAPEAVHLGSLDLDRERALQLPTVFSEEFFDLAALDEFAD
jgi:NAD+ synthase (glutamine-hydrolysing)